MTTKRASTAPGRIVRRSAPGRSDPLAMIVRGIEGASKFTPLIQQMGGGASDELARVGRVLSGLEAWLGVKVDEPAPPPSERLAYLSGLIRGAVPKKARG